MPGIATCRVKPRVSFVVGQLIEADELLPIAWYRDEPRPLGRRAVTHAFAAGNRGVLKGPELSLRSYHVIVSIFRGADLPGGVLNFTFRRRQDVAPIIETLMSHPAAKKADSTAIGRIVVVVTGKYLKHVIIELDGKASAVILSDANSKRVTEACRMGSFQHDG